MENTNYINGVYIKTLGDTLLITCKTDEFIEQVRKIDKNGMFKIKLVKRKSEDKYGNTHFACEDTFQPKATTKEQAIREAESTDDLPF